MRLRRPTHAYRVRSTAADHQTPGRARAPARRFVRPEDRFRRSRVLRRCRTSARSKSDLTLRVLRRLARLLEAVLATFLLTRVAREEAGLLEYAPLLGVERDQCARDAEADGAGLAADPAAAKR